METVLLQTSLVAAFIAGMVALFAPCCITFLLPAYLGSVFKEKEKVILMTLVFGLGIFIVLLPAVLGVAAISKFLFRYHDITYLIGAVVMLVVAVVTFLGIKLPMPQLSGSSGGQKTDILSIFTLGIFSGITSACCAPVLMGILTLTFLSPNFFGALAIGAMYVLGMVIPLLAISLFLSGKMPAVGLLRKRLMSIHLAGHEFPIITSNLIAAVIFLITGILIFVLTLTGGLSMDQSEGFTRLIQDSARWVDMQFGTSWLANVVLALGIVSLLYWIAKKV